MAAPSSSDTPMSTPRRRMPRRTYPLCILGVGLGGTVVATVLWERQAPPLAWTALSLTTLVQPHMVYLFTRRATDPYAAEVYNLLIDSALVITPVPLMYFNLLPNVMLLTLTVVDRIATDIRGLWMRAPWAMLAASMADTAVMELRWASETSMCVIVACLPVMSLYTLSVSAMSYQLIQQSACQNQTLDELHYVDAPTGLFEHGHWQEWAGATLRRHHITDEPAYILMLDIGHLGEINDAYGRIAGDEVIRALVHTVQGNVRVGDCAECHGGNEFAIVLLGVYVHDALAIAQRIREQTGSVRLHNLPEPRITSNISVAPADYRHSSLRVWIGTMDAMLYITKNGGRNQAARYMEPAPVLAAQQSALRPASGLASGCRVHRSLHPRRITGVRHHRRVNLCAVALYSDVAQCEPYAHPLELRLVIQALEHAEQGVPSFSVQ